MPNKIPARDPRAKIVVMAMRFAWWTRIVWARRHGCIGFVTKHDSDSSIGALLQGFYAHAARQA